MSGRFTYQSNFETVGNPSSPDILYYNASIVNNNTDDSTNQLPLIDPQIRFNETRDTAIIKDASKYQFSIIRFVMNGANKDLPLFIPCIQSSTGQVNVNLTEYGLGITWEGQIGGTQYNFAPDLTYAIYLPETQNTVLAPTPRTMASPDYVPTFVGGNDVGWVSSRNYYFGNIVYYTPNGLYYSALPSLTTNNNQPPDTSPLFWAQASSELGQSQDLSTRYYWVYTYSHWVDIINTTLDTANRSVYAQYFAIDPTTYADYADWIAVFPTPIMSYNNTSGLFSIYYPTPYLTPDKTTGAFMSLYFNSNMEGLFANFDNVYTNQPVHPPNYGWITPSSPPTLFPFGYANLQVVKVLGLNNNYSSPTFGTYTGGWYQMTQDYISTSSLWSPIDSIVFTSTLLPIQNESTAQPNALGTRNTGVSSATSQSAFTPIITDIALDLSTDPAGYRKMIYYSPNAEYRMADFQNSKQDIRSIDIQVYWKNRLDNNLYPVSMFNFSSVSFKLMFRKKDLPN